MEPVLIVEPGSSARGLLVVRGSSQLTNTQMRERLLEKVVERLGEVELSLWPGSDADGVMMIFKPNPRPAWSAVAEALAVELALKVQVLNPELRVWQRFEVLANNYQTLTVNEVMLMLAWDLRS